VNEAYNIAKQGGKHSGFYNEYTTRSNTEIQKGIDSINKQISEHQDKIRNPQKYISNFNNLDPRQQKALPKKWQSDIKRQIEQKTILEGILKERGQ
jgi:peptidoglycan hydrolase CwlO-like protein